MPQPSPNLSPEHPPEAGLVLVAALLVCALTLVCLNVLTISVFHSATRVIEKRRALDGLSEAEAQLQQKIAKHAAGDPLLPFASHWRPIGIIGEESRSLLTTATSKRPYPSWLSMQGFAHVPCLETNPIQGKPRAVARSRCTLMNYRLTEDTLIHGNLRLSGKSRIESSVRLGVLGDLQVDGELIVDTATEVVIEILVAGDIAIDSLRVLSPETSRILIYSATGSIHVGAILSALSLPLDLSACKPVLRLEGKRQVSVGTSSSLGDTMGCPYQRSGNHWNALTLLGEDVND